MCCGQQICFVDSSKQWSCTVPKRGYFPKWDLPKKCSDVRTHCLFQKKVGRYLVLVCIVRSENFTKRGLIDYNIDCFKTLLAEVFSDDFANSASPNFINEVVSFFRAGGGEPVFVVHILCFSIFEGDS